MQKAESLFNQIVSSSSSSSSNSNSSTKVCETIVIYLVFIYFWVWAHVWMHTNWLCTCVLILGCDGYVLDVFSFMTLD